FRFRQTRSIGPGKTRMKLIAPTSGATPCLRLACVASANQCGLPHDFPKVTIRIRETPETTPWLTLCRALHFPARSISAFQDGVQALFAGGEITQDGLR